MYANRLLPGEHVYKGYAQGKAMAVIFEKQLSEMAENENLKLARFIRQSCSSHVPAQQKLIITVNTIPCEFF